MPIVERHSPWLTIEGVLLILLGMGVLLAPMFAGIAAGILFGWVLVMAGVVGLASAFAGRAEAHFGWSLASAIIALGVGLILIARPLMGAVTISLFLAAYLLMDGVTLMGLAMDQRKRGARGWAWIAASGALDFVLAVGVVMLTRTGAAILVGFMIGVDLIAAGIGLVAAHQLGRKMETV
jgi:uncharacterized membrane protein HdeD (DUF308 family)